MSSRTGADAADAHSVTRPRSFISRVRREHTVRAINALLALCVTSSPFKLDAPGAMPVVGVWNAAGASCCTWLSAFLFSALPTACNFLLPSPLHFTSHAKASSPSARCVRVSRAAFVRRARGRPVVGRVRRLPLCFSSPALRYGLSRTTLLRSLRLSHLSAPRLLCNTG